MPPANTIRTLINHYTYADYFSTTVRFLTMTRGASWNQTYCSFWAATKSSKTLKGHRIICADSDKTPWQGTHHPATSHKLGWKQLLPHKCFECASRLGWFGFKPSRWTVKLDKVRIVCGLLNCKRGPASSNVKIKIKYSNYKNPAVGNHFSPTRWKTGFKYQADDPTRHSAQDLQWHLLVNSVYYRRKLASSLFQLQMQNKLIFRS